MKVHISVVIPAHNEEKYIKRCIDSIKYADSVFPGNTEINEKSLPGHNRYERSNLRVLK